jgi:two-component system, cell cycle sensor histidine kinase and response regulator CckA
MTLDSEKPESLSPAEKEHDKIVRDQREANENLVLLSMRAQDEKEQAEAARAVAESDRARLFEHAGWGVAMVSDADNHLVAVNPAFASMHGYSVDELVGCELRMVCPPLSHTQLVEDIQRLHDKGHHLFEGSHIRKDGSQFPCLTEATAFRDSDGKLTTSAYNFQDVSEQTQLKARLAVADRLAALGTMSAGIAHEINNPLTYNLSSLSHVQTELPALIEDIRQIVGADNPAWAGIQQRSESLLVALKEAQEGAERIERIVASMKTFARPVDHDFQVADLTPMLEAAMRICHERISQRAKLVHEFRKTPHVNCNDGQLGQVFVNLLMNAAQAIEPALPEQNEVRVLLDTDLEGHALIEISDTGCGIAPEVMKEIYDPFFTTKPVGVGTGLGLSISQSIIAAHGGQITVESVLGKGTVFRIRLPLADGPVKSEVKASTGAPTFDRRANILIVDDDANVGRALQRPLARHHEVVVVRSAKDAIALLDGGAVFDVIFCDLMMPEMTGMEFYGWVAMNHPHLAERMLFITGGAANAESREFIERMADRIVNKPFAQGLIQQMVGRFLERRDPPAN